MNNFNIAKKRVITLASLMILATLAFAAWADFDPENITLANLVYPSHDEYYDEDAITDGDEEELIADRLDGSGEITCLKFPHNLSSVIVTNASLNLYTDSADRAANENLDVYYSPNQSWVEGDLDDTCNNGATNASANICQLFYDNMGMNAGNLLRSYTGTDGVEHWDVIWSLQEGVQSSVNAGHNNVSFCLNHTGDTTDYYYWRSSDHPNTSYIPYLNITYSNFTSYYFNASGGTDAGNCTSIDSACRTISYYNSNIDSELNPGDSVFFARGEEWRLTTDAFPTFPVDGSTTGNITFGAYGTGANPVFLGSVQANDSSNWTNTDGNLWYSTFTIDDDIGGIIVNDSDHVGDKRDGIGELADDMDFYYNSSTDVLWVNSSSNPASRFSNVELSYKEYGMFSISNRDYLKFENLHLKYGGVHGFYINVGSNIHIMNCTVEMGGGASCGTDCRYGNGVEFWDDVHDVTVYGTNVSEWYDACLTFQRNTAGTADQYNINFSYNVLDGCGYGVEYFNINSTNTSNVNFKHNTIVNSGEGWQDTQDAGVAGRCFRIVRTNESATHDWYIQDNICYNTEFRVIELGTYAGWWDSSFPAFDYNLYYGYGLNFSIWDETVYTNFTDWQAGESQDANSLESDPLFVDAANADFTLASNSPACSMSSSGGYVGAMPCDCTVLCPGTYYVNASGGDDSNDGLSESQAWKTLNKVEGESFSPGDTIYFARGETWEYEHLTIWGEGMGSGNSTDYLYLDAYGTGDLPVFDSRNNVSGWDTGANWTDDGDSNRDYIHATYDPIRLWVEDTEYVKAQYQESINSTHRYYYNDSEERLYLYYDTPGSDPSSYSSMKELGADDYRTLWLTDTEYVNITNLNITAGRGCSICLTNASNVDVHDLSTGWWGRYGVNVVGEDTTKEESVHNQFRNLTIHSGYFMDNNFQTNINDGVKFGNGVYNNTISNSTISNWGHTGVSIECFDTGFEHCASYNYVYGNYIDGGNTTYMRGLGTGGWYGNCTNNHLYHNTVVNTTVRNQIQGNNNFFYNNTIDGVTNSPRPSKSTGVGQGIIIESYPYDGYELISMNNTYEYNTIKNTDEPCVEITWNSSGHVFRNNTFYNCGRDSWHSREHVAFSISDWDHINNMTFEDNIIAGYYDYYVNATYYRGNLLKVPDFDLNESLDDSFSGNEYQVIATENLNMNRSLKMYQDTYYLNDTGGDGVITIGANDITLDCNGATLLGNDSLTSQAIFTNYKDGIVISGCNISGYRYGVSGAYSDNYQVKDNTFGDFIDYAIIGGDSRNVNITGNVFGDYDDSNVYLYNTNNTLFYNNSIVSSTYNYYKFLLYQGINSYYWNVSHNNITLFDGFRLKSGHSNVHDNYFSLGNRSLYAGLSGEGASNISYFDNTHENGYFPLYFTNTTSSSAYSNLWYNNTGIFNLMVDSNSSGITVNNNNFTRTDTAVVINNASSVNVTSNWIYDAMTNIDSWASGIRTRNYAKDFIIWNNTIHYGAQGVLISQSDNGNISNNTFNQISLTDKETRGISDAYEPSSAIAILEVQKSYNANGDVTETAADTRANRIYLYNSSNINIHSNSFNSHTQTYLRLQGSINITHDIDDYWYRSFEYNYLTDKDEFYNNNDFESICIYNTANGLTCHLRQGWMKNYWLEYTMSKTEMKFTNINTSDSFDLYLYNLSLASPYDDVWSPSLEEWLFADLSSVSYTLSANETIQVIEKPADTPTGGGGGGDIGLEEEGCAEGYQLDNGVCQPVIATPGIVNEGVNTLKEWLALLFYTPGEGKISLPSAEKVKQSLQAAKKPSILIPLIIIALLGILAWRTGYLAKIWAGAASTLSFASARVAGAGLVGIIIILFILWMISKTL